MFPCVFYTLSKAYSKFSDLGYWRRGQLSELTFAKKIRETKETESIVKGLKREWSNRWWRGHWNVLIGGDPW